MLLFDGELYSNACRRFFSQKEIFFLTILKFFSQKSISNNYT